MDKLLEMVLGVVVAVGASAVIFIGANLWFDQARNNWLRFGVVTGTVFGLGGGVLLAFNRLIAWKTSAAADATDLSLWLIPMLTVLGAVMGALLVSSDDRMRRAVVGIGGGAAIGILLAVFWKADAFPALKIVPLILWPIAGVVVFGGYAMLRSRDRTKGILTGASLGWLLGALLVPSIGGGTRLETILALGVLGALVGARLGIPEPSSYRRREALYDQSRATIFLAPALVFVAATLVIPTIRTIWLSFLDSRGRETVGFRNYGAIFSDPTIFKVSNWTGVFSSSLFYWSAALIVAGIAVGIYTGRKRGRAFESNGSSVAPIAIGGFLLSWAVFAYLRGTIFNNLWWVVTVVGLATSLGLAVAVLADRSKGENVAKSIIFLPMAISFVGAGIIWAFMFIARPETRTQTGVFNSIWVGLGKLSNSSWAYFAAAVLAALAVFFVYLAWRGYKAGATGLLAGSLFTALPFLWLAYRFVGPGLGGFQVGPNGDVIPDTILFLQEAPFNNVWLMVVLIWIQTGFAMVILSAAIKAVPSDLIEAAKVDGATEAQTFWRVTVPQIMPTIGVVVTTLIVLVMKVFDIVKVMTNGNFDTQVLANEMWQRAFTEFNLGLGSAVAVVLFVAVLPVMYVNVRRMQKEAA